ncbi:MAG: hypothetical protein IKI26_09180 [Prevotella sp.]|nr:hypothetical protein [Prevotella sp.]
MKKIIFTIALTMVAMMAEAKIYLYDVNKDGIVNITDVTTLVNKLLGTPTEGDENFTYDINYDGVTNIADVTCLVNGILGVLNPKEGLCPDDNHPHLIDLGLPSGTKWSCCNVGADTPESYGGYYAWGETEEKEWYDRSNYTCLEGVLDKDDIAWTEYDVAYQTLHNVGMPSRKQGEELIDNCTSVWTTVNSVPGWLFISTNHEGIFLPAAGWKEEAGIIFEGRSCNYWLSKASYRDMSTAYCIYSTPKRATTTDDRSYHGSSVRPVSLPELKLSTSILYIGRGQTRNVPIKSGSGNYTVESSDKNDVSAAFEEYDNSIRVDCRSFALNIPYYITVTDTEFGQTFTLEVRVVDNLDISKSSLRLATFAQETLSIYGTGHYAIKVENEDVAVATQEGSTLLVKGLDVGTTDIEVTDTLTNQSKFIHVTVFFVSMLTCSNDNHPHLIDLGLPSGTRWACCNVGAEVPEAYGDYYAWGETAVKESYDWSTYIHCKGKRNTCFNLGEDIASTEHDVAHVVWRSSWRMPSEEQFRELLTNCDREWTSINGVNILKLTGPSGGTISLPLAGYIWGSEVYEDNEYADYWTSTVDTSDSNRAISFGFYPPNDVRFDEGDYRYTGLSVRPVFQVSNQSEGNTANSQP